MTTLRISLLATLAALGSGCETGTRFGDAPAAPEPTVVSPAHGDGPSGEPFPTDAAPPVIGCRFPGIDSAEKKRDFGWLEHADTSFIVFGKENGRLTVIIEGYLLREGATLGDYVVVAIGEDGIRLREIDGTGTRTKAFGRGPIQGCGPWE